MEGYRILIVEDHVQSRTTMAEYLRRQEGVALVREAGNGAEALKLLSEEPFEIMITDIIMPQMDGYALLEALMPLERGSCTSSTCMTVRPYSRCAPRSMGAPCRWAISCIP